MRVELQHDDLVLSGPGLTAGTGFRAGFRIGLPLGRLHQIRELLREALTSAPFQAHLSRPLPSPRRAPLSTRLHHGSLVVMVGDGHPQLQYAPRVVIPYRHLTALVAALDAPAQRHTRAAVKHRNAKPVPAPRRVAAWRLGKCSWRGCGSTVGDAVSGVCSRHYGQNRQYIRFVSGGAVGSNRRH